MKFSCDDPEGDAEWRFRPRRFLRAWTGPLRIPTSGRYVVRAECRPVNACFCHGCHEWGFDFSIHSLRNKRYVSCTSSPARRVNVFWHLLAYSIFGGWTSSVVLISDQSGRPLVLLATPGDSEYLAASQVHYWSTAG